MQETTTVIFTISVTLRCALRLKNEHSMHNSCIKIFRALPAATATFSNGILISPSLKQSGLGNCFAVTNNIPSKTGCRHWLPALQHSSVTPTYMVWYLHIAECLIWTLCFFDLRKMLHYLSLLSEVCIPCSLFLLLTLHIMRSMPNPMFRAQCKEQT